MKFDLVIRGGAIVTATDMFRADLGILNGKIASLASELPAGCAEREMDAAGKYVMPGGIDVHVHFQLPFCGTVSADDFLSGTRAAACGGVTTVIDFATQ
ncbi:MAG TPA: amidohydrolase family protein, partial [Candidatus Sumerlaeota bacterium]|nr:amidohydrolase family protein [Candidatus Sumerlaeota bacterium]